MRRPLGLALRLESLESRDVPSGLFAADARPLLGAPTSVPMVTQVTVVTEVDREIPNADLSRGAAHGAQHFAYQDTTVFVFVVTIYGSPTGSSSVSVSATRTVFAPSPVTVETRELEDRPVSVAVEDELSVRAAAAAQPAPPTATMPSPGIPTVSAPPAVLPMVATGLPDVSSRPVQTTATTWVPTSELFVPGLIDRNALSSSAPGYFLAVYGDSARPALAMREQPVTLAGDSVPLDRGALAAALAAQTNRTADEVALPGVAAAQAHAPWLAGLLTPLPTLGTTPQLLALEQWMEQADALGQHAAHRLHSVLTSPWFGSAIVVIATSELARRRVRQVVEEEAMMLDVPEVTGPSELT
jgi:hypothetical protein